MNFKTVSRVVLALFLVVLVSSFTFDSPVKKYSPAGTWEYSVPGIQDGYETGSIIITQNGKEYKITMVLNEYFKTEAKNVVYKKKSINFSVWVETEEILVSGTFEGDEFTGTLSYSEGDFDINASRNAVE